MKNIWDKVHIHSLTHFFIISMLITGYFNMIIALVLIITIHETGHIIAIKYYKYHITKIEFFPFGGLTKIDKDINSPIKEELIISISGIIMQIIIGLIMLFLWEFSLVRYEFYTIFKTYNIIIIIFNIIPMIPLDGHLFVKSIFEYFFSFRLSSIISFFISLICLIFLLYFNIFYNLNNYLIIFFLIYKLWEYIKTFRYTEIRFYLERYLHQYNFPNIKIVNEIKLSKMFKEKTHYFIKNGIYYKEDTILRKKFDKYQ